MASWTLFDNFRLKQHNGNALNLAAGGADICVALITSAVAPAQATNALWSNLSANEVTGGNYTAGGIDISAGQSLTLASGTVTFTSSSAIKWSQSATGFSNARYAVIYDKTSGQLVAFGDLGANQSNVNGDYSITLDASGIWTSP